MKLRSALHLPLIAALGLSTLNSRAAEVLTPGFLKVSLYTGLPGTAVADLSADPNYPAAPAEVRYLRFFNSRDALPTDALQDFGGRIEGFVTPQETGEYVFFLRSERSSELWLSADDTEGGASLIAEETDYGDSFREQDTGDLATSQAVQLTAGRRYFILVLYKAGNGGGITTDYAQVAWRKVGDPTPAGDLKPIPGAFLSTLASDADAKPIEIQTQPVDLSGAENTRVTLTLAATSASTNALSIQWQRNGVNIPGATGPSYPRFLDKADRGARFRALLSVPGLSVLSSEAAVSVTDDSTAPTLVTAQGGPNRPLVFLDFSERLNLAAAEAPGNYRIATASAAPLEVLGAALSADGTRVTLTTGPQTPGTQYTVTVNNLTDRAAAAPRAIAPNTQGTFHGRGPWIQSEDGFVVFEAEDYDRNLDGLWSAETERGVASGGVAMVNRNGAGGNENDTRVEYDIVFTQTGTHRLWYRNSANDGNDDSVWLFLDGTRPPGRETGNFAALSSFTQGFASAYGWASSAFEGGGQMTFDIAAPGLHTLSFGRREDGAYLDKFVVTLDPSFNPTAGFGAFGPPVTLRQGDPAPSGAADFTITLQPRDISGAENAPITLTAGANVPAGFLFTFQWQRRQGDTFVAIPGATVTNLTINPLTLDWDGAVVRMRATVSGVSKFTDTATIRVIRETTPPELVHLSAPVGGRSLVLHFSENLARASAETAGNYRITGPAGPLAVTAASLLPANRTVVLTTAPQTVGAKYTLTVNGVTDTATTPNPIANVSAAFYTPGALLSQRADGLLVVEAESFDRNLDELWTIDARRGNPSGGASAVNANGAGGSEAATRIEFDLQFTQVGTHILWYRAGGNSGNDDSIWLYLDGARPPGRTAANLASISGFNGVLDFAWRSNPQEGGGQMTFPIAAVGQHTIGFARREDGAFLDKFLIATDPTFNPNEYGPFGPPETRQGIPALPTLSIISPEPGDSFQAGSPIPIHILIGASTRTLMKVEFFQGTNKLGETVQSPFEFTWTNPVPGTNAITARVQDDALATVTSKPVTVIVNATQDLQLTHSVGINGLTLTWSGGSAPYRVQRKNSINDPAWQDVLTTSETTATLPLQGASGFFRIASP